jgi:transposase-like protein
MKTIRTVAETRLLAAEAERRARDGESLVEIARTMGVPTSTLSDWALKGGWRRKDLQGEKRDELVRLTQETIAAQRQSGPAPPKTRSTDAGGAAAYDAPEFRAMSMAQILLERGHLDDAEKAIRIASRFVVFREQIQARVFKQ